jgi:hypothetical protein
MKKEKAAKEKRPKGFCGVQEVPPEILDSLYFK